MPASPPSSAPKTESLPPVDAALLALAPMHLPNRRNLRYLGDELCVAVEELAARDQTLCRKLYDALSALLYAIADTRTEDAEKWQAVMGWVQERDLNVIIDEVRELGQASHEQGPSEVLSKTLHDLRGGALSALLGRLQIVGMVPRTEHELNTIFTLTRDHLKIMRNALTGLDEDRRNADRQPKSHDVHLIIEKWHDSVVGPKWRERPVRMLVDCRYQGALTECCLESAAIDRIFYNLANNACRHVAGDQLEMVIFPVPASPGDCLRFVLSNEVAAEDAGYLRSLLSPAQAQPNAAAPPNLTPLFEAEVSSTGSGFGLTVVADFVAKAFGLRGRQEALTNRYVGAVLDGNTFRIWFHWPKANDALPPKLDDYHQPEQSLSEP